MCERRELLHRQIEAAFPDTVYPGDDGIADDPSHCSECMECDDWFRGRHWRQTALSGERLPGNYGGLSFLSADAWRYFLPAYLLAAVAGDSENSLDAAANALFHLTPRDGRLRDWFDLRASGFNERQRAAFVAFLDYWHADHPDWFLGGHFETARNYWARPAG